MEAPTKGAEPERGSEEEGAGAGARDGAGGRSRRAAILTVLITEFIVPLVIVTGIGLGLMGAFSPPEQGYLVGALRVLPFPESADDTLITTRGGSLELKPNILAAPVEGIVWLGPNLIFDEIFESDRPVPAFPGKFPSIRVRLGDVVRVGTLGEAQAFVGVIHDPLLRFERETAAPLPPAASWGGIIRPAQAEEEPAKKIDPRTAAPELSAPLSLENEDTRPAQAEEEPAQAEEEPAKKIDPRTAAPELSAPLSLENEDTRPVQAPVEAEDADAKVEPPVQQTAPSDQPPAEAPQTEPIPTELTNENVIAGTVMVALLRADTAGLTSVLFAGPPPIWAKAFDFDVTGLIALERLAAAIGEGIRRVAGRLVAVDTVYIAIDSNAATTADHLGVLHESGLAAVLRALWGMAATPLPWPGGDAFLEPVQLEGPIEKAAPATLINPAHATPARATVIPAFIFLGLWLLALLRRVQAQPVDAIAPGSAGILAGLGSAAVLAFLLYGLRYLAPALSGPELADTGDLALVGTTFGASVGAAVLAGFGAAAFVRRVDPRWLWPPQPVVPKPEPTDEENGEPKRDNLLRSILYSDNPIDDLDDDRLGFRPVIEALHLFLDNKDTKPPVVVAVNGPWGSGKTSIMKILAKRLRQTGRFHVAWFNAWQYHREEQILAAFLKTVADQLRRDWGWKFALRLAWVRLKRASLGQLLVLVGLPVLLFIGVISPHLVDPLASVFKVVGVETIQTAAAGTGTAGMIWLSRFFQPFVLQFRKLGAARDPSARIGFIDEFRDEFELYRDAMGADQKFLIVIDDLDRCLDRNIVDVLKTINLIVSGDRGASRTFFILGYDPKQVIPSVELHFHDLLKGRNADERFGESFMKKIVTLTASVPHPKPEDAAGALAGRLDPDQAGPPEKEVFARAQEWLRDYGDWLTRLAFAVAIIGGVVLALHLGRVTPPPPPKNEVVSNGEKTLPPRPELEVGKVRTIAFPDLTAPGSTAVPWLSWLTGGALVLAAAAAFARRISTPPPPEEFRRPAEDSQAFKDAINACGKLMPPNPRDIVRLMNLMRLTYLVQERDPEGKSYRGVPLDERESISLTLLQQRHPEAFAPKVLRERVIAQLGTQRPTAKGAADFYKGLGEPFEKLAADIVVLSESKNPTGHLVDAQKLWRFHDVNYYELALVEHLAKVPVGGPEPPVGEEKSAKAPGEPRAAE